MAVPFVLHSQPTAIFEPQKESTEKMTAVAQRRYVEIRRDVEELINDHSKNITSIPLYTTLIEIQLHTRKPARTTAQS
jgi:hypothetical protein